MEHESEGIQPRLPPELFELIIEKAAEITNDPDRSLILSNLALLSHFFHDRVNKTRFETVDLYGTPDNPATGRIHALRDMVEADPRSAIDGLASRIRNFKIRLCGDTNRDGLAVLHDGSLTSIMGKLFKNTTTAGGSSDIGDNAALLISGPKYHPCSFTLHLAVKGAFQVTLNWILLGGEFLFAFLSLLQNPSLTTLNLINIKQLPPNILRNSFVQHATFRELVWLRNNVPGEIQFGEFNSTGHDQAAILKSFTFDDLTFPYMALLDFTPSKNLAHKVAFSQLESLTVDIFCTQNFVDLERITACAPNIQDLTMIILCHLPSPVSIELGSLSRLRNLNIVHKIGCHRQPVQSTFSEMHNMFHPHHPSHLLIPPRLHHLGISFLLLCNAQTGTNPKDIFTGFDYFILDEIFSKPPFLDTLSSLAFTFEFSVFHPSENSGFDMELFLQGARTWFREHRPFPMLDAERSKGTLKYDIIVHPKVVQRVRRRPEESYIL